MNKQLTPEQLMIPRYKVIAKVPFHSISGYNEILIGYIFDYSLLNPIGAEFECNFSDYPHLFKKLAWWEDRTPEEMPGYVKYESGEVRKILSVDKDAEGELWYLYQGFIHKTECYFNESIPATEEEYNSYIASLTSNKEHNG